MKLSNNKTVYLFIPGLLFLTIPLYGFFSAIYQSLQDQSGLSFHSYIELMDSQRFLSSLAFSIRTSFIATLLALVIGLIITRCFYRYMEKSLPRIMVWIPMLFPHFVWGYIVILLLSETGLISQWFMSWGFISDTAHFPILTRDPQGVGIIITYVWKEVPFVILMLLPVYTSINTNYHDLVATLGGSKWEQWRRVDWPHMMPIVFETFLIIFSFTLSAYEVPALLGTTFPEMVSVLSYQWFYGSGGQERSLAFAAMVSISCVILLFSFFFYLYLNKRRWRAMRGRL